MTARERPDVALVGLGESSEHALELIERIVKEAACPVIVIIHAPDPWFINEAAKRGVFAYITDGEPRETGRARSISSSPVREYQNLEGAFGRRAMIERAKGIMMERHAVDDQEAFEMLRGHSRSSNRKLVDVASALMDSHLLLRRDPAAGDQPAATS